MDCLIATATSLNMSMLAFVFSLVSRWVQSRLCNTESFFVLVDDIFLGGMRLKL